MRAVLTFRLPQEREEFDDAVHGSEWRWTIQELDEYLKQCEAAESIRNELYRILEERNLTLYV